MTDIDHNHNQIFYTFGTYNQKTKRYEPNSQSKNRAIQNKPTHNTAHLQTVQADIRQKFTKEMLFHVIIDRTHTLNYAINY
ncbi:hypothetical protein MASR2M47_27890 [Draconibacterium sp.]